MFLYAYHGDEKAQPEVEKYGLGYAFEGAPQVGFNYDFKDLGEAKLLADTSVPGGLVRVDLKQQTWRKWGDVWVGYYHNMKPGPESLLRKATLKGRDLPIRGVMWQVPTAVSFDEVDGRPDAKWKLSRYIDFTEAGEPIYGDVEEQFAPLYDIAMNVITDGGEGKGVLLSDVYAAAPVVLGYNYRISYREAAMLGLLSDRVCYEILDICVDASGIASLAISREDQKKSLSQDGSSTNAGATVEPGIISPLAQTS